MGWGFYNSAGVQKVAGGWTAWTPQVSQNGNKTSTNNSSRYVKIGNFVTAHCCVTITAAGTSGHAIGVDLPITNYTATGDIAVGAATFIRISGPRYQSAAILNSTYGTAGSRILFQQAGATTAMGVDTAFALASGDYLTFTVSYEAA
jgi:hypothetical protein